jgi:hypothetical protein
MAEPVTTKTSESSWIAWQLMHLSFEIGFIRATTSRTLAICEEIRTRVMAMEASPQTYGRWAIFRSLRERLDHYEWLLGKLWRLFVWSRLVFWPVYGYSALRWLGWLS